MGNQKKKILQAAFFASDKPLSLQKISEILNCSEGEAKQLVEELKKELENTSLELVQTKTGYEMRIKPEYREPIKKIAPFTDLTPGMARTLGLIILNEPVRQSELVKIQGNKVYEYVSKLEEKGLIKTKKVSRTKIITLTSELERYFGANKEELKRKIKEELS